MTAQPEAFDINTFYNDLPIRIVGTHVDPFFYACDLGNVLGLRNVATSITHFTHHDIVTPEMRRAHNIVTTKLHRGQLVRDDRIVLLTERGAFMLLMNSKSPAAEPFITFIFNTMRDIRLAAHTKLHMQPAGPSNPELVKEVERLTEDNRIFHTNAPIMYVYSRKIEGPIGEMIRASDLDEDIHPDGVVEEEDGCILYKYTTRLSPADRTEMTFVGNYCVKFAEVGEDIDHADNRIVCDKHTAQHTRYTIDTPPLDIECLKLAESCK